MRVIAIVDRPQVRCFLLCWSLGLSSSPQRKEGSLWGAQRYFPTSGSGEHCNALFMDEESEASRLRLTKVPAWNLNFGSLTWISVHGPGGCQRMFN